MKKTIHKPLIGIGLYVGTLFMMGPAFASSMPKADLRGKNSITLGSAPSLAMELSLNNNWAFGGSIAAPILFEVKGFVRYSLHTSYTFLETDSFVVRGLIGTFGDLDYLQRSDLQLPPIGIQAGIEMSYQINQWVIARANFVPGIGIPQSKGYGLFPPAGGVEAAFRPFNNFEASLGLNGNGDILALRYLF